MRNEKDLPNTHVFAVGRISREGRDIVCERPLTEKEKAVLDKKGVIVNSGKLPKREP